MGEDANFDFSQGLAVLPLALTLFPGETYCLPLNCSKHQLGFLQTYVCSDLALKSQFFRGKRRVKGKTTQTHAFWAWDKQKRGQDLSFYPHPAT